tara:strand:- start:322 stop:1098 length:777 start_codon:yes stop_codon:yes gene_type:complete
MTKQNYLVKILNILFLALLLIIVCQKSVSANQDDSTDVSGQCRNALEWYDDHPGYKGEFVRVLDYCKKYAKDVSPEGYVANPILSDFGSMNGVNTRPRDNIHQGIDIIGPRNNPVIAIADGIVLETTVEDCWGATIIIDHGESIDGKNLITIYGHVGRFLVNEGDTVKRGDKIAELPIKIEYRCMARVRHLHLQIGQRYCKKEEKDNWACKYFIKDFYRSLNPHKYWADGPNNISCFDEKRSFKKGTITYPLPCKRIN